MIYDDMKDITDVERDAIPVGKDLQELKTHGNLEFPITVYPVTLSKMYLKLIRWHWHPEIEMIYILDGRVEALVDDDSVILSPGQGIFVNQNVLHAFHLVEDYDAVFFSVVFHPAMIFGYGSVAMSVKYLSPILENPQMKYLILGNDDPYTAPLIDYMKQNDIHVIFYQELSSGKIADAIANETGATKLVFHTVHNASQEEINKGETYISLMRKNLENLEKALN